MTKGAPNQSAGLCAPSVFAFLRRLGGVLLCSAVSLLPLSAVAQISSDPELNALAALKQGDGETARALLLPLIWSDRSNDQTTLVQLRRLVIKSYLVEGRHSDAHSAMLRYEQDYSDAGDDPAWIAIKARVMIADGQPDDAALVAVVSDDPEGKAVYALAHLKGYVAMDEQLLQQSMVAFNNTQLDQPLHQALLAAALNKAIAMPVPAERIVALQQLLSVGDVSGVSITAAVDGLWSAYSEYGQEVANRLQLLVGDFTPWFDAASRLQATAPVQAQALYVWLALHAEGNELQTRAHQQFFLSLLLNPEGGPQGDKLLRTLYLSSSYYTDPGKLPAVVRQQLVDIALIDGDLAQAAQLLNQADTPDGVEWQLRRVLLQREIQRHSVRR